LQEAISFSSESKRPTQHVTTFVLSINTNDDYDEDDDEEYDFFEDYCAPDDDAILTLITRGDDHTPERYGRAIDSGVFRLAPGGVLRRGLGGCGNFGTFLYLFSLFFSAYSKKWTTDRERCAKVHCNRARRERLALVVVIIVGRRARLFLDSLWMMMMMGVRNSKFRAGK
tara:strand:- start:87 stop:596 length:510 start_codon:yes stop_codon:yes gene_type:complete